MNKNFYFISSCLVFFFSLLNFSNCTATEGVSSIPQSSVRKNQISVSEISLLTPDDKKAQSYLGLSGEKNFTVPQIKADVILINVFSTICPHCQEDAPNTNKLFQAIEDRPDLKGKIKIIGIGTRNSLEDVTLFKEEFKVPFPLFADEDMSIFTQLAATGTPTMIGIKLLFRKAGSIGEVSWFLDFLLDMAHLDRD